MILRRFMFVMIMTERSSLYVDSNIIKDPMFYERLLAATPKLLTY